MDQVKNSLSPHVGAGDHIFLPARISSSHSLCCGTCDWLGCLYQFFWRCSSCISIDSMKRLKMIILIHEVQRFRVYQPLSFLSSCESTICVILQYLYSQVCIGQETEKGPLGLQVKLPPVYHTRCRLHTLPFYCLKFLSIILKKVIPVL